MSPRPGPATLVVGVGPLSRALATQLAPGGPVVLASPQPQPGPWFWRRVNPATGEGVKAAATSVARVVICVDAAGQDVQGAFIGLRKAHFGQGVVVHPIDADPPAGANEVPRWGRLAVGAWWGQHEPLWGAWRERALAGRTLKVPDLGPVGLLAEKDVADVVLALFDEAEARWRAAGPPSSLQALADHARAGTAATIKPASVAAAARQAGVSAAYIQRFADLPSDVREMSAYDNTWRGGPARVRGPTSAT